MCKIIGISGMTEIGDPKESSDDEINRSNALCNEHDPHCDDIVDPLTTMTSCYGGLIMFFETKKQTLNALGVHDINPNLISSKWSQLTEVQGFLNSLETKEEQIVALNHTVVF